MLGLVTCSAARALDTDLPLLVAELPEARIVTWDDPTVDWSAFGAVVIRSTWDYHAHLEQFLDWARRVAEVTALWNPPQLIEWNVDKRYLLELAASGIPIVPTQIVDARGERPPCEGDIVVKPSVGAGSIGVRRFDDDPAGAYEHIDVLHARGAVAMVQRVRVGGRRRRRDRHGVHRRRLQPCVPQGADPGVDHRMWRAACSRESGPRPRHLRRTELAVAELVVATLPATAYARVDLLPTGDGPVVLELEVIEPSLFLHLDPTSPARAAAVFRNLVT